MPNCKAFLPVILKVMRGKSADGRRPDNPETKCPWRLKAGTVNVQLSAVITRSDLSQYYIRHSDNWQKVNQILESQHTPHISPSRASYGVSVVRILEKIDCVMTAPRCTLTSLISLEISIISQQNIRISQVLFAFCISCCVSCTFNGQWMNEQMKNT